MYKQDTASRQWRTLDLSQSHQYTMRARFLGGPQPGRAGDLCPSAWKLILRSTIEFNKSIVSRWVCRVYYKVIFIPGENNSTNSNVILVFWLFHYCYTDLLISFILQYLSTVCLILVTTGLVSDQLFTLLKSVQYQY